MHVALSGSYVYAADDEAGLFVVDVSNPATPVTVRAIPTANGAVGVVVAGEYAYATGDSLWVVDISNPPTASLVAAVPLPDAGVELAVAGGALYVSTEYWGVYAYDIEEPTSPRVLGGVYVPGSADGIAVSNGNVFVDTQTWFVVLPTHCSPATGAPDGGLTVSGLKGPLRVSPNPSSGETVVSFEIASVGDASIEVFDLAGRRVRELAGAPLTIGPQQVAWNGRDDHGRRLPGGAYFVRLSQQGRSTVERLVLVR